MTSDATVTAGHDRRKFLGYFSALGLGATLLPGVLWAKVSEGAEITPATIACAEEIAGVKFTDEQRQQMVDGLKDQDAQIEQLHKIPLDNAVPPALLFDPVPPGVTLALPAKHATVRSRVAARAVPGNLEELAFLPVTELSELVRRRKVTSTQLTEMYLRRIEKYDPTLRAVITLTEERARRQARAADEEIARGRYRGPLHGIPWGAKDLLAVKGYKTTWGAGPFRDQVIDADATVVQRLDAAGAVLVAKLTLGELAQGDIWFGGTTKNPWNVAQGSSGSSAGPASAVAAGLVGFAIGTETLGSISSPSTRNGATGLRPTFGRVPRTGAMALSWSMDKIGPIARSVEDCALVLAAIHGPDGYDRTVRDIPFSWDARVKPSQLRIGYFKSAFDLSERNDKGQTQHGTKKFDDGALDVMRKLGARLVPVEVPDMNYGAMRLILVAEGAAAFDELTRSGRDAQLVQQTPRDWANTFRAARFIPAVDYVNANRVRTLAMQRWHELFEKVDVIVTPTGAAGQLIATNLTGNPAVILPSGFRDTSPTDATQVPVSLTFLGGLYREATLLAVAKAWQDATDFHLKHPVLKA
jgi:Asp-tRNA(Asn)/Glu-tRNA(Gln) amidotransferase A subunit family amidase